MYEFEARMLWEAAANARTAVASGRIGDAVFHVEELEALAMHTRRRSIRARALSELGRVADAAGPRRVVAAARDALSTLGGAA